MLVFLIIVSTFYQLGSIEIEVSNTSSPVLFTLVGQAALKTAYGHLLIPLNLSSIKESFDQFDDIEKSFNKLTTTTDEMSEHRNAELENLRGKLDIVHHLALTKARESHFKEVNTVNVFHEKLTQALGIKQTNGNPGLLALHRPRQPPPYLHYVSKGTF